MKNLDMKTIDSEEIELQAAEWLLTLEENSKVSESDEFKLWLQQSEQHEKIFHMMSHAWHLANAVNIDALLEGTEPSEVHQKKNSLLSRLTMAFEHKWIPSIAIACCALVGLWLVIFGGSIAPQHSFTNEVASTENRSQGDFYQSGIAQDMTVSLIDGSQLYLGANSEVTVDYNSQQRNIHLVKGEALFEVAKDANRPFTVYYQGRIAQALGTVFNVKESAGKLLVHVLEGKVKVDSETQNLLPSKTLVAGEAIRIAKNGSMSQVMAHNYHAKMDWQQGNLVYIDAPLSDVIYDLKRHSNLAIYIQHQSVSEMKYTGNIVVDNLEVWLDDLPRIFPLTIQKHGDTRVIVQRE
ncbi:FecR family protein [Thalassotalea marina]|uniref:FecR protein domain-containing protein n=1 Tax=Thalassotalea marina TaxID=1673741 RepID=A0A919EL31_9GAMM|nr:FecR domain-containing protein [Thalassotalea marina]GHF92642.1 hypothetical protein GCM10017161_21020 [Thalassotalea marina]